MFCVCAGLLVGCGNDAPSPRALLARAELSVIAAHLAEFNRSHDSVDALPRTPATVPCGPVTWVDHDGIFRRIGYNPDHVVPFSFELTRRNTLRAYADRDCDHEYAIYEVDLSAPTARPPTATNDAE